MQKSMVMLLLGVLIISVLSTAALATRPVIISPANNSASASSTVLLNWTYAGNATYCAVSIDGTANNTNICSIGNTTGFNFSLTDNALQTNYGLAWNGSSFFSSDIQMNIRETFLNGTRSPNEGFSICSGISAQSWGITWNGSRFFQICNGAGIWSSNSTGGNVTQFISDYGQNPGQITWNGSHFLVTDSLNSNITIMNSSGAFVKNVSLSTYFAEGSIRGITTYGKDIYIVNKAEGKILKFNSDFEYTGVNISLLQYTDSLSPLTTAGTSLFFGQGSWFNETSGFAYAAVREYALLTQHNLSFSNVSEGNHSLYLYVNDTNGLFNNSDYIPYIANNITPQWSGNASNATISLKANDILSFVLNASDNWNLSQIIFSWNMSGSWANVTLNTSNSTFFQFTKTLVVNSTGNNRIIGFQWFINDSYGNKNNTPISTLSVNNTLPLVNVTMNASVTEVVQDISCTNVTFDADSDVLSVNVDWWVNTTFYDINYSVLGSGNTSLGANITCQVNVSDGYSVRYFNSSTFTIGDATAPIITKYATFDLDAYTQTQNANISANCTDNNQVASVKAHVYSFFDSGSTFNANLTLLQTGTNQYANLLQMSGVGNYGILGTYCTDGSGNVAFNGNLSNASVSALGGGSTGGGGGGSDVCSNPLNCNNLSTCCFGFSCVTASCVQTSTVLANQPRCGNNVCEHLPPTYSEDSISCQQDCPLNAGGLADAFTNFTSGGFSKILILGGIVVIGFLAFMPSDERSKILGRRRT